MQTIEHVASLRSQLWDCGFRPVPVLNADKVPIGKDWGNCARKDPPDGVRFTPVAHALNTGLLCDGLRAIDLDIDDAALAKACRAIAVEMFGEAPIRWRSNSPRCLLLYRAAEDNPAKASISGTKGKVEVLGRGQQFVAFGTHPSGAELEWFPDAPGQERLESIPAVSEAGILEYLRRVAPIIGAEPPKAINGHDHPHAAGEAQADPLRIAAALASIPNGGPPDWEAWNRVGMAVWRATGGLPIGWELLNTWSARNSAYSAKEARSRWDHYFVSPPDRIGAGTIFHIARALRDDDSRDNAGLVSEALPPPPDLGDGYWASVMEEAGQAVLNPHTTKASGDTEPFEASPIDWDAMLAVAPREWVYGHFLIKRFISVLGAPGGTGKTAYAFTIALCLITGQNFIGETVHEPGNVWIYNLEDPRDELFRRFRAAAQRWGVGRSDVEGRLFLDSGRDRPLVIAAATRTGGIVVSPIVTAIIEEIKRRQVRVLIVDPFVRSHRLEENVNEQIDFAAALWGEVADKANCSVLLVHHFRKGGVSGDASAFRGASALIDAARSALSLATMSEDEAGRLGVAVDDRWQYIRVDNAKLNLAPPPESTTWLKLIGEDLGNAANGRPSDRVQTVERWEPPTAWDGMPWSMIIRVLDKIDAGLGDGEFYAAAPQAKERWAGTVLMEDACKTSAQAKVILKEWISSGALEEGQYASLKMKKTSACVRLNKANVEKMRQSSSARGIVDD